MARRVSRPRFIRPAKGKKVWLSGGFAAGAVATGKNLLGVLNASALLLRPFTVLRTRLFVNFQSDQLVASENPQGAFGMIVVSDTASGVGITAVPGPVSNTDAAWLVYEGLISPFVFVSAIGFQEPVGQNIVVDSKAMRKVGHDDDLIQVVEIRGADDAIVSIEGRILVEVA